MKNLFIVTILLLGYCGLQAQSHVELGLKAGLNVTTLAKSNLPKFDPRVSFHVGGLAHIHLSRRVAIQPELTFSGQGAKNTELGVVYHSNFNYINLPVLFQYMWGNGFRLETGPQLGALISAKSKTENSENNIIDHYKRYDFSWALGLGYLFHGGIGIDARYNYGISNIYNGIPGSLKNSVFQLGLFYQISGGHEHKAE